MSQYSRMKVTSLASASEAGLPCVRVSILYRSTSNLILHSLIYLHSKVFDNTPAAREGTLEAGDELVGVNGVTVKGKTKVEVAKMIQATRGDVSIKYNKLHADPKQGKTLDIVMKKVKHKMVENMTSSTADALGLSR